MSGQMQQDTSTLQVNDPESERYVLGSILLDESSYYLVAKYLSEDCFYTPRHKDIYKAIESLAVNGKKIDMLLVGDEMLRLGITVTTAADIMEIMMNVASPAHIEEHALRIFLLARRRKLWMIGQTMSQQAMDETKDLDKVQQQAMDGMMESAGNAQQDTTICGALGALMDTVEANQRSGHRMTGTQTGFLKWDDKGGLQPGDLVILAADSSMGKTSLAITIARNAIEHDAGVAFYSMEMTKMQITARYISPITGIPSSRILYATDLTEKEQKKIKSAAGGRMEDKLYIDDESTSSLDNILMSIRMMKARYNIKGAIIDYLQILGITGTQTRMNREQVLGSAARRIKNLAKELGVWIIALSQLSRGKERTIPSLSRIRDSGQIVEAADVVLLLYRPDAVGESSYGNITGIDVPSPVDGTAMIDIAKGRNIGTFRFFARFDKTTTSFKDMSEHWVPIQNELPFPMPGEVPY